MTPKLALDLSNAAIRLIRTDGQAFETLGEARVDSPDFGTKMQELHDVATALVGSSPGAELILPNSEILFTCVETPDPHIAAKLEAIRDHLDGRTPYDLGELSFDWADRGEQVYVAAVALETLAEADAFIEGFGFRPLGYTARPEPEKFDGFPVFGDNSIQSTSISTEPHPVAEPDLFSLMSAPEPPDATQPAGPGVLDAQQTPIDDAVVAKEPDIARDADAPGDLRAGRAVSDEASAPKPTGVEKTTFADDPKPDARDAFTALAQTEAASISSAADDGVSAPVKSDSVPGSPSRDNAPPDDALAPQKTDSLDARSVSSADESTPASEMDVSPEDPITARAKHLDASPPEDTKTGDARAEQRPDKLSVAPAEAPKEKRPKIIRYSETAPDATSERDTSRALPPLEDDDVPPMPAISPQALAASRREKARAQEKPEFSKHKSAKHTPAITAQASPAVPPPEDIGAAEKNIAPQKDAASPAKSGGQKPSLSVSFATRRGSGDAPASKKRVSPVPPPARRGASGGLSFAPTHPKPTHPKPAPSKPAPAKPTPAKPGSQVAGFTRPAPARAPVSKNANQTIPERTAPRLKPLVKPRLSDAIKLGDTLSAKPPASAPEQKAPDYDNPFSRFNTIEDDRNLMPLLIGVAAALLLAVGVWVSYLLLPGGEGDIVSDPNAPLSPGDQSALRDPIINPTQPALTDPQTPTAPGVEASDPTETPTLPSDELTGPNGQDIATDTRNAIDPNDPLNRPSDSDPNVAARYTATGIWAGAPVQTAEPVLDRLDDLYIASIDPAVPARDPLALPLATESAPIAPLSPIAPPAANTDFDLNDRGLVRATPEGALTPQGVRVFLGAPALRPGPRPAAPEQTPPEAAQVPVNQSEPELRPRARPGDLIESNERAILGGRTRAELAAIKPRSRPATIAIPTPEPPSDPTITSPDEPTVTEPERPVEPVSPFAIASSPPPKERPRNIQRIVRRAERARTPVAAVAPTQPRVVAAPAAIATPRNPTRTTVARAATQANALNLRGVTLIGVSGTPSNRRAVIRFSSGNTQRVQVGDRVDGGRVTAITTSQLSYRKGGRNIVLQMPSG